MCVVSVLSPLLQKSYAGSHLCYKSFLTVCLNNACGYILEPYHFYFAVKFYPPNPTALVEDITR